MKTKIILLIILIACFFLPAIISIPLSGLSFVMCLFEVTEKKAGEAYFFLSMGFGIFFVYRILSHGL
ncbi:MAG: hypothetical protein UT18_C0006G0026 [candidate division CPR2 bacterium GW2011_GWC2_39_10]|uniref:Uncharacterized protein n=1 Tax=candidate division CPR2 bacterium GW2011_GWC2_39_10 TaxID=1618345 RepID=A0A0G0LSM9_UNCC2|nr:MAG: hypothetical protein UT18_C0006G0026 [candidate division CPR2 bacterium GW2011_GWC2_39_10]